MENFNTLASLGIAKKPPGAVEDVLSYLKHYGAYSALQPIVGMLNRTKVTIELKCELQVDPKVVDNYCATFDGPVDSDDLLELLAILPNRAQPAAAVVYSVMVEVLHG